MIFSETGNTQTKGESPKYKDARIFARHYVFQNKAWKMDWIASDFTGHCQQPYLNVSFIKDAFTVTDLNEDGQTEVWFLNRNACGKKGDPENLFLNMYVRKKKHFARSFSIVPGSEGSEKTSPVKFDEAFDNQTEEFKRYAEALIKKHAVLPD